MANSIDLMVRINEQMDERLTMLRILSATTTG